jgi:hypothetical protein
MLTNKTRRISDNIKTTPNHEPNNFKKKLIALISDEPLKDAAIIELMGTTNSTNKKAV